MGNVFHAGDGNLHPNILYDPRVPGEEARVVEAGGEILKVCAAVGGSISGEHGIGLEKMDYMPLIFTEADLGFMRELREAFNPRGLCNPGKIFPRARHAGRPASPTARILSKRRASPSASSGAGTTQVPAPSSTRFAASSDLLTCSRAPTAPPTCSTAARPRPWPFPVPRRKWQRFCSRRRRRIRP